MKPLIYTLLLLSCPMLCMAQQDTFSVYFPLNKAELTQTEQFKIDSLIYQYAIQHGKQIVVAGYADYLGEDTANMPLSERRAKVVYDYLLQSGFNEQEVIQYVGYGEIASNENDTKGQPTDRRVDIITGDSVHLYIPEKRPEPKKQGIDISKVRQNETLVLRNIYFEPGTHTVREISHAELYKLYLTMKENPMLKIKIEGHVCCIDPKRLSDGYDFQENNSSLSLNRAKEIYDYLVSKGIDEKRMSYEGFGASKKLATPEITDLDKSRNRRVEIRILEK